MPTCWQARHDAQNAVFHTLTTMVATMLIHYDRGPTSIVCITGSCSVLCFLGAAFHIWFYYEHKEEMQRRDAEAEDDDL